MERVHAWRARGVATLLAGVVAGGVVVAVPLGAAASPGNTIAVPAGGIIIHGKGFGHGRGMSQYGAYGAATAGLSFRQILGFYYPGTRIGYLPNPQVRVRLTALDGGVLVLAPYGSALTVSGLVAAGADGRVARLPAAGRYRAVPTRGAFAVQRPVGRVWGTVATLQAPVTFTGVPVFRVEFGRRKGDCKNGYDAAFSGSVRAVYYRGRPYYQAVLPMERYLRGVLSSEMPATWPAEAVRAQAVAARTYAAWARTRGFFYDVRDDTGDQCWDGLAAEHWRTNVAIGVTRNGISTYGGRPILAQFSASNGGFTNAGAVPYLPGRADPYEARARSPYLAWQVGIRPERLAALDGAGGVTRPTRVTVLSRDGRGTWGGRVIQVRVYGYTASGGSGYATFSGETFRRALGMRSNYFGFTAG
jgi:peptidoglycan hydrolase-like amidase